MFALINHQEMKKFAPIQGKLEVQTCFNTLGLMTNAVSAKHGVLGVFHPELMLLIARALKEVGLIVL